MTVPLNLFHANFRLIDPVIIFRDRCTADSVVILLVLI